MRNTESSVNPVGQSASSLAALVRFGDVAPTEVIRAHLARIAAIDSEIGAFQRIREHEALAEAAAVGSRQDLRTLPLAGVPIGIKDNVPLAGEPMRVGSLATSDKPCDVDHPVVQRLREAGAIIVGTTRVPEMCLWGTSDNAFGITRNPWDARRTAGGSSGGSAAAVAAAMVPLAHAADGLGSIRIPAACCGLIGLKPGAGVVPAELGESAWYGMSENGVIATTVEDGALMLSVLARRGDFRDPATPQHPLRVAMSTRSPLPGVTVDSQVEAATLAAGRVLADAGHIVERTDPPPVSLRFTLAILRRWFAGAAQDARNLKVRRLERRTRTHVRIGRVVQQVHPVGPRDREAWRCLLEPFFRRFHLLITPVLAMSPIAAERWSDRSWAANIHANARFAPFAAPWNLAGYPAAAVPAGVHSDGLPLSVQLVAPLGGEQVILSVAKQLELLRPWRRHILSQTVNRSDARGDLGR